MKLLICSLALTATALAQDVSLQSKGKRCIQQRKTPIFNKEVVFALTFEQCEIKCNKKMKCLLFEFQEYDVCILTIVNFETNRFTMFGPANCQHPGIPSKKAPGCEKSEGHPVLEERSLNLWHSSLCINLCEDKNACILWRYNKENTRCTIFKLEVDPLETTPTSEYGRNFCSSVYNGDGLQSAIRTLLKISPPINVQNNKKIYLLE